MNWLRIALLKWLNKGAVARLKSSMLEVAGDEDFPFDTSFSIVKATNGVLLKVTKYRPAHGHHSDFKHEIHIVKDDETVVDTIRRVLVLQQLEK
jgi:hypothetical protein